MSQRYIKFLIDQVRRETENQDFSETLGIKDDEFIQYLNDAQDRLESVISATHPKVFTKEIEFDIVPGQQVYDLPFDAYMDNRIATVEYAPTGDEKDYFHLEQSSLKRRDTSYDGFPVQYIRRAGQLILQPTPQGGGMVRLNYAQRLPRLDLRRGVVAIATLDSATRTITQLELDPASSKPPLDTDSLTEHNYLSFCDRDGNITMKNVPFDAIDTASGVITISAGFVYDEGETIVAGSYSVGGRDTSTHSPLPRMCERYLKAYCVWKILKRDSSVDYAEQQQELLQMEQDITNSFSDISDDVQYVPLLNFWDKWSL